MIILSTLYDIIIAPIEYAIEFVFCFIFYNFRSFGMIGAITGISLAVNILALPLYLKADELQLAERKTQERMGERVKRIKQAFHGDEQFMILSEYYKRNHYHPLYTLRSSLSILIEIPFFIAAYHFLSSCSLLSGWSEWIFRDMSKPDGLLMLPLGTGIAVNVLPVLMTLINFISTAIYTKGAPVREKAQAYLLAVVFLVILYSSPSGLVFYWILNNLFSLFKNLVMKLKRPIRAVYALYAGMAALFLYWGVFFRIHPERLSAPKGRVLNLLTILWLAIPVIVILYNKIKKKNTAKTDDKKTENTKSISALVISSCLALWIMAGALLPSSVIATSPTEFSFLGSVDSPLTYVFTNLTFYFGLFVFWPLCIYKMFQRQVKGVFPSVFFGAAVCAVFNIYLFQSRFGNITTSFEPENRQLFTASSASFVWMALLPVLLAAVLCVLAFRYRKQQILTMIMIILALTGGILSVRNMVTIKQGYDAYAKRLESWQTDDAGNDLKTEFSLAKNGHNVMVIFCDRFASAYFPYLLEQFPELKDSYEGFVYYPNCISFSTNTLLGAPAMMGGYEYTPRSMNDREGKLVELHNESAMALPIFFDRLGYDVKVADPPHVNYEWEGDYTPFEAYPGIEACSLVNNYKDRYEQEYREEYSAVDNGKIGIKNCRLYAMVQILYPPLRNVLAGGGRYYSTDNYAYSQQEYFIRDYAYALYLPRITRADNDRDTYTFIELEISHEYQMLLAPDYHSGIPTEEHPYAGIGNYPDMRDPAFGISGENVEKLASSMDAEQNIQSYHVNACTILLLAKYLDALKEMGVYDNTRIIIVSDHGSVIPTAPFFGFHDPVVPSNFNPMLLYKDFNSTGEVRTDMSLRTNADTPYLATEGLGVSQVNPFTGNLFGFSEEQDYFDVYDGDGLDVTDKKEDREFHFYAHHRISGSIFDENNWEFYAD